MTMTDEWQSFGPDNAAAENAFGFDVWVPDGAGADDESAQGLSSSDATFPGAVPICLVFAAPETATQRVLAIPVLARALREVHLAGWTRCSVYVQAGWQPSDAIAGEIARLAPDLQLIWRDTAPGSAAVMIVDGERLASQHDLASAGRDFQLASLSGRTCQPLAADTRLTTGEAHELFRAKSRELLDATAKPGDGIVTRYFNRPISQRVTRLLLRLFGSVHPNAATAGTACIGAAMFACQLQFPGHTGLVLGAVMFQAASVFDGVDGEIARATFRATPLGASADSLVDAAVNILFFVGVIANLFNQGDRLTAGIGVMAIAGFVFGTVLLGYNARRHPRRDRFQLGQAASRKSKFADEAGSDLADHARLLRVRCACIDRVRFGGSGGLGLCHHRCWLASGGLLHSDWQRLGQSIQQRRQPLARRAKPFA